jgi:hypothetical protein
MRTGPHVTLLGLLVAYLAACGQAAVPETPIAQAAAATPAPASAPTTSAADAGLAIAVARETADRAVREQTLHVQQQLREQERVREAAVRALNTGDVRCIAGQKMRRVGNGWVQAGTC